MAPERPCLRTLWQPLIGVAVVLYTIVFIIGNAQAAPLFSDGGMNTFNWFSNLLEDTTSGQDAAANTSNGFTGGNPDAYIEVEHVYTGPGALKVGHTSFDSFYLPQFDGALSVLTYSIDVNFFNTPGHGGLPPGAVSFLAMLFQGGGTYQAGFQIATAAVWATLTFANLLPTDFVLIDGIAPVLPDFSVFGDLMLLGFLSGNGSGFGGQNIAQLCSVLIISPPATGLQDCHCRRVP
jgi:hypothetical protein